MTILIKQSTAVTISFGPAVINSDGVTYVTNLTGTGANQTENTSTGIRLSKNGGALAARHATAGASNYDAFGMYLVPLDATDTGSLGALRMTYGNAAAFCPITQDFMVVAANIWDALVGATVGLKVDVDTIKTNPVVNGGTITFPTTATLASTTNITAGTIATVTTLTNLPAITANWLTAAGTAADFDAELATAIWTDVTAGDFTVAASVGKSLMNGVSLGTGLTVAAVTGAVGSVTGAVGSVTGAVGSVTGAVGSVTGAVGSVTGAVGSVTGAVGSVTGNVGGNVTGTVAGVTPATAAQVAAVLTTQITEAYRANGAAPTLAQFMSEVLGHLGEVAISGTTKTINKLDHATAAETFTLDNALTPAAITRAT